MLSTLAKRASRSLLALDFATSPNNLQLFSSAASGGLYGLKGLNSPKDWHVLVKESIARCEDLINEVQALQTPSVESIRLLDNISVAVCEVYDPAEFCRNTHQERQWRNEAEKAVTTLGGFVQQLNTHQSLYTACVHSLEHYERIRSGFAASTSSPAAERMAAPEELEGYTPEAVRVAQSLKADFEKQGIHLGDAQRQRFMELEGQMHQMGMQICQNVTDVQKVSEVRTKRDPRRPKERSRVPATPTIAGGILTMDPDEDVRKSVYKAYLSGPAANVQLIDELAAARREQAELLGHASWAHRLAADSLAGHPGAVHAFLAWLQDASRGKASEELQLLRDVKRRHTGQRGPVTLHPWDRQFYMARAQAELAQESGNDASREYFSLEGCIAGLDRIFGASMGVRLEARSMEPGEAWAPDIRKLEAVHETEGPLGIVYLDLHARPGKFHGAAQFVLRCGRKLPGGGGYAQPKVALAAGLPGGPGALLSYREAQLLFHEFGHAMHSLLSRTDFQHCSGTRGAMDVVEVHSHLLEHFLHDPASLPVVALHHVSGEPMPARLAQQLHRSRTLFTGLELETQIMQSMMDQQFHGPEPLTAATAPDWAAEYTAQHCSFPYVPGTNPQATFTHLVGYGGCYYSYLYAEALASAVWEECFAADPLNRAAGSRVRRQLYQPGGSVEPRQLIGQVLGPGALQQLGGGFAPAYSGLARRLRLES